MNKFKLIESISSDWQRKIDLYLREEGYPTYANRFNDIKLIVADSYHGSYISVAAMIPTTAEMIINPSMLDERYFNGNNKKMMDQISVLVRHELLHFLLMHQLRLEDHVKKINPEWEKELNSAKMHELANYAMDWDLSREGYDAHDKEVVRLMSKNGRVIGGLILEDDHPEWLNLSMEEMYDELKKELNQRKREAKNNQELSKDLKDKINQQRNNLDNNEKENEDKTNQDNKNKQSNDDKDNEKYDSDDKLGNRKNSKSSNKKPSEKSTAEDDEDNELDNENESNKDDDDNDNGDGDKGRVSKNDEDSNDNEDDDKINVSKEYTDAWNRVMDLFDNDNFSSEELEELISAIESQKILEL